MFMWNRVIVGYLTPDSDLDLAPDPDQFGALPPVRYINSVYVPQGTLQSCSEVVKI